MPTRPKKPIKVFYSPMTQRFYATQHYKEHEAISGESAHFEITGKKYDVTADIGFALTHYDIEVVPDTKDDSHADHA